MPFTQSGYNATATFDTYNDIGGDQTNTTKSTTVGNITSAYISQFLPHHCVLIYVGLAGSGGNGGTGVGVGVGKIAGGAGSGGSGGSAGSVTITPS